MVVGRRRARQIHADGMLWLVYELASLPFDRRSAQTLVFENDGAVRLVRDFPSNWRELTDAELHAVSFGI
jgi:hypothetical protein